MNKIFSEFRNAGISNLIVDLRYNPGGDIDAAVHLASGIAPSNVVTEKRFW
jgi:C-terminal processing protease CtpA/Prc